MPDQQKFLYSGYIEKIAQGFDQALERIEIEHNFEYGPEFEVALCKVFRRVLPQQFGICRGYVVNETGEKAGDDIIIFDKMRFPTIRSQESDDYSTKEQVPIEAAFAYIEAKHTLDLDGNGPSSLKHASDQAMNVKELCSKRPPVSLQTMGDGFVLSSNVVSDPGWPNTRNPMLAGVIARRIRMNSEILEDHIEAHDILADVQLTSNQHAPDLFVAGRSNLIVPTIRDISTGEHVISGFYIHGESGFVRYKAPNLALAVGLCCLLWAIDWIQLQRMPWQRIIANALGKLDV